MADFEHQVHLDRNAMILLECPECERTMMMDGSEHQQAEGKVNIRHSCACGYSKIIFLERRKSFRKPVDLVGVFRRKKSSQKSPMRVKDISRYGLCFESRNSIGLSVKDQILLAFYLDNRNRTLIRKEGIVRNISPGNIHVEFVSPEMDTKEQKAYDRAIAFYLFT